MAEVVAGIPTPPVRNCGTRMGDTQSGVRIKVVSESDGFCVSGGGGGGGNDSGGVDDGMKALVGAEKWHTYKYRLVIIINVTITEAAGHWEIALNHTRPLNLFQIKTALTTLAQLIGWS